MRLERRIDTVTTIYLAFSFFGYVAMILFWLNGDVIYFPVFIFSALIFLLMSTKTVFCRIVPKPKFILLSKKTVGRKDVSLSRPILLMIKRIRIFSFINLTFGALGFLPALLSMIVVTVVSTSIHPAVLASSNTLILVTLLFMINLLIWPLLTMYGARRFEILFGFSKSWKEAMVYLHFSRKIIKQHLLEGIIYFKNSLIAINKNLKREKESYQIETRETLKMLDALSKTRSRLGQKILAKYIDKLIYELDNISKTNKGHEKLTLVLYNLQMDKRLSHLKIIKTPSKISHLRKIHTMMLPAFPIIWFLLADYVRNIIENEWPLIPFAIFFVVSLWVLHKLSSSFPSTELMHVLEKEF